MSYTRLFSLEGGAYILILSYHSFQWMERYSSLRSKPALDVLRTLGSLTRPFSRVVTKLVVAGQYIVGKGHEWIDLRVPEFEDVRVVVYSRACRLVCR